MASRIAGRSLADFEAAGPKRGLGIVGAWRGSVSAETVLFAVDPLVFWRFVCFACARAPAAVADGKPVMI